MKLIIGFITGVMVTLVALAVGYIWLLKESLKGAF